MSPSSGPLSSSKTCHMMTWTIFSPSLLLPQLQSLPQLSLHIPRLIRSPIVLACPGAIPPLSRSDPERISPWMHSRMLACTHERDPSDPLVAPPASGFRKRGRPRCLFCTPIGQHSNSYTGNILARRSPPASCNASSGPSLTNGSIRRISLGSGLMKVNGSCASSRPREAHSPERMDGASPLSGCPFRRNVPRVLRMRITHRLSPSRTFGHGALPRLSRRPSAIPPHGVFI